MHRVILVPIFAALMVLGAADAALADDRCADPVFGLLPGEVSLCQTYCTHLECDSSAPQASASACANVAVNFKALVTDVPRPEIIATTAMCELDNGACWTGVGGPPPGGGCF